jgi:uncharacterized UPF0160 family protein
MNHNPKPCNAKAVHPSGEIIKLPCYCPWKEHLFELEEEKKVSKPYTYSYAKNIRVECFSLNPSTVHLQP